VEFNVRLLANDLTNQDKGFDWFLLAQRLELTADEVERIRNCSSSSPYLMSSSPANQTYDLLSLWVNRYTDEHAGEEGGLSAGEVLMRVLREMGVEEEIIGRNVVTSFASGSEKERSENLASVEKSFAKLNTNSDIAHEDRDFTKVGLADSSFA